MNTKVPNFTLFYQTVYQAMGRVRLWSIVDMTPERIATIFRMLFDNTRECEALNRLRQEERNRRKVEGKRGGIRELPRKDARYNVTREVRIQFPSWILPYQERTRSRRNVSTPRKPRHARIMWLGEMPSTSTHAAVESDDPISPIEHRVPLYKVPAFTTPSPNDPAPSPPVSTPTIAFTPLGSTVSRKRSRETPVPQGATQTDPLLLRQLAHVSL